MKRPSTAITEDAGGPLNSDFLDDLVFSLDAPEVKRHSFKEGVQRAAREFRAGRASPKVDVIRREITSLAKAVAKVLNKPTQKKREALRWLAACKKLRPRLDKLSPEATDYLLRHRPPHDRSNPPWGTGELSRGQLEELYALCCVGARLKETSGDPPPSLKVKYGPVRRRGRPADYAKIMLISELGYEYESATGKEPFRGAWDRDRGPFVQLVDGVLGQLGEESDDTNLIRKYLEARDTDSQGRKMP